MFEKFKRYEKLIELEKKCWNKMEKGGVEK